MNPLLLLDSAVVAIHNREGSGTGEWYICWIDNGLQCRPTCSIPKPEIIFATLNASDILDGLTARQWDDLTKKLITFHIQKGLKP